MKALDYFSIEFPLYQPVTYKYETSHAIKHKEHLAWLQEITKTTW